MAPHSGFGMYQLAVFQKPQAGFGPRIRAKEKPDRQSGCSPSVLEGERVHTRERSQVVSARTGTVSSAAHVPQEHCDSSDWNRSCISGQTTISLVRSRQKPSMSGSLNTLESLYVWSE